MTTDSGQPRGVPRRSFVSGAAVAGTAVNFAGAQAADAVAPGASGAPQVGADVMVDVLRSLDITYVASNPGSSFRGLHESIVNYAGNVRPEFLTCLHEETSAAMAHGYVKACGKPMAVLAHSTVGLQHAAMAIYNAWCDRAPLIGILGNIVDATHRRPGVEWTHTAQDPVAMVRDFVKWDDQPGSLQHFAESMVRAYKIAMTPPMAPVIVVADGAMQEASLPEAPVRIPRLTPARPPQGDAVALGEVARLLVNATAPVLIADRLVRSAEGLRDFVALAELVGAAVVDQGGRMNFPSLHPLQQNERAGALIRGADVIVGFELTDAWGTINEFIDNAERTTTPRIKTGTKVITIGAGDLYMKSNYQDFQRYADVDLAIAADGETTLPALIAAVESARDAAAAGRATARRAKLAAAKQEARAAAKQAASYAWDARPIATARLAAEVWAQIKGEDWSLVSTDNALSNWARRLWPFERHYQYLGNSGGYGVGYGLPAAVGAALAHRDSGRFAVNIQTDGDLMYAPGALWTAVHHKIPLLTVMHNNRAYHQEVMHVQRMANRQNRGIDRAHIGTTIDNPFIDYTQLAKSMGMWAEGPIDNPGALAGALKRAVAVVKSGAPALVDVVTQPR